MLRKLIILTSLILILSGCFDAEQTKNIIKRDISDFFKSMILEEEDKVMELISPDTEFYYDYYSEIINTFSEFNLDYEILEVSFEEVNKKEVKVDALVHVSGTNIDREKVSYDSLYSFTFEPVSKTKFYISDIVINYKE